MIAILDPCLLDPKDPLPITTLDPLVRMLHQRGLRVPQVQPYERRLIREFLQPLSTQLEAGRGQDPIARRYLAALDQLRARVRLVTLAPLPLRLRVWGFRDMFSHLGPEWLDLLVHLTAGCVLTGEETLLLTRLAPGRNLRRWPHGSLVLHEKTIWNLRVRAPDQPLRRVPCICSPRNLTVPFTTRYDDTLPARGDGVNTAFYFDPPASWHKRSCPSLQACRSRPAWIDARGSGWAEPNTPGEHYHWDVYLEDPALAEEYGLDQLNIVRFGAPPSEKPVGEIPSPP